MMAFEYAVLRVVPRVDRGECLNAAVVLYCQSADYLAAGVALDVARLAALAPGTDVEPILAALAAVRAVCSGDPAAGSSGEGTARARFGWLTAPRSTVVQPGAVHAGLTQDPAAELDRLLDRLVRF